jgi:cytochrome P450
MSALGVRYDPYAYETHEDPYPIYRALRDEAPAYVDERRGFWALSRHDDVRAALDDWPTFSSTGGITLEREPQGLEPMLIEMDPPRHTELRALVSRSFTPRRVAGMETPTRAMARELLDTAGSTFDAIGDFAATRCCTAKRATPTSRRPVSRARPGSTSTSTSSSRTDGATPARTWRVPSSPRRTTRAP